jgi:hypothetical protein
MLPRFKCYFIVLTKPKKSEDGKRLSFKIQASHKLKTKEGFISFKHWVSPTIEQVGTIPIEKKTRLSITCYLTTTEKRNPDGTYTERQYVNVDKIAIADKPGTLVKS